MFTRSAGLIAFVVEWNELTLAEQLSFLRQGYKPPEGTIIHGNGDIEDANTGTMGHRTDVGDPSQAKR